MLRANGDKVLVEIRREEKVSKGGIIMATEKEERYYEGKVINCGEDDIVKKYDINPGDYVYYEKGTNYEVEYEGKKYDLVSVLDIIAKGE